MGGNLGTWREAIRKQIGLARSMEGSDQTVNTAAYHIGSFAANMVDPENPDERLLREMWVTADENEQRFLAGIIARMMSRENCPQI